MTEKQVSKLLAELEGHGLSAVDAHRSAFAALAFSRGWSKAKIGRFLGISRARVGQKIDKLWLYANSCPTLEAMLEQEPAEYADADFAVGFEANDWQDIEFARALVDRVGRNDSNLSGRSN